MNVNYEWAKPKPKPENVPDGKTVSRCGKCGGNGVYAMAVMNGQPWSVTGTKCYPCNGTGWVIKHKPRKKITCEKCGAKIREDFFEYHEC